MPKIHCEACDYTHKNVYGPSNPTAQIVVAPWHIDQKGLQHYAAGCLRCGGINDVAPSYGMLIGRGWKTYQSITPSKINSVNGTSFAEEVMINGMKLPELVVAMLMSTTYYDRKPQNEAELDDSDPLLSNLILGIERIFETTVEYDESILYLKNGYLITPTDTHTIYLNPNRGHIGLLTSVGHELLHQLKRRNPKLYNRFARVMFERMNYDTMGKKLVEANRVRMGGQYGPELTVRDLTEEMLADLLGEQLLESEMWVLLGKQFPQQKMAIDHLVGLLLDETNAGKIDAAEKCSDEMLSDTDQARKILAGYLGRAVRETDESMWET